MYRDVFQVPYTSSGSLQMLSSGQCLCVHSYVEYRRALICAPQAHMTMARLEQSGQEKPPWEFNDMDSVQRAPRADYPFPVLLHMLVATARDGNPFIPLIPKTALCAVSVYLFDQATFSWQGRATSRR
jgi:hypothetical protein